LVDLGEPAEFVHVKGATDSIARRHGATFDRPWASSGRQCQPQARISNE
jgi:hypothetical protein